MIVKFKANHMFDGVNYEAGHEYNLEADKITAIDPADYVVIEGDEVKALDTPPKDKAVKKASKK